MNMNLIEIIFINDASTDGTLEKLKEYQKQYPNNIKIIDNYKRIMQGASRNKGIDIAEGDYIAFVDADDAIHPTTFEEAVSAAMMYDAEIVRFLFKRVTNFNFTIPATIENTMPNYYVDIAGDQSRFRFFVEGGGSMLRSCWDKIYKRDFVIDNNLRFAEGLFDEECLFTTPAYLNLNRLYLLNKHLYYYYKNENSTIECMRGNPEHKWDNVWVWEDLYRKVDYFNLPAYDKQLFEATFVVNYFFYTITLWRGRKVAYNEKDVVYLAKQVLLWFPFYEGNEILRKNYGERLKVIKDLGRR